MLWSLLVLSGLIYVVVSFDEAFDMSSAFFTLFRRYAEAREYSGDSRLDIWLNIVRNVEPYFIGRGYVIEVGGEPVQPHSDAIRFVYAYGILLFFMVLFFLGFMLYNYPLFAIPAIAAFFINTLIDEQKLLALYFCWAGVIFGLRRTEGGKTRGDIHSCFFR